MRLRHVSATDQGWSRRRAGRGFVYLDENDNRIKDAAEIERIKALVIPPAWTEVWICKIANGHLQCVGTDDAGRRQYLYHPDWRQRRDEAKFDRVLRLAKRLPRVREQLTKDLRGSEPSRQRVLAAAVRMLDLGFFRIGGDLYADEHGSYGLTTLLKKHVAKSGAAHTFRFIGKSGIEHEIEVREPSVNRVVEQLRTRRGGGDELLAYKERRRWHDVNASDVNDYLRELFDAEFTAKDFRTWHATVLAAAALGTSDAVEAATKTARRRAVKAGNGRGRRLPREHLDDCPQLLCGSASGRLLRGRGDRRVRAQAISEESHREAAQARARGISDAQLVARLGYLPSGSDPESASGSAKGISQRLP